MPRPFNWGVPVTGIHHPAGSHKRISFGVTSQIFSDQFFQGVVWNSGVTEGGSSGPGLWEGSPADARLVGELSGGASDCADPTITVGSASSIRRSRPASLASVNLTVTATA